MPASNFERNVVLYLRLVMAWIFLYASLHQLLNPAWSADGFLGKTKTFHALFALFAAPAMLQVTNALVEYGMLLIGLSLLTGLLVRVSSSFGVLLMILYWMAHLDFPYVIDRSNFLVSYHCVYLGVLLLLIARRAGHYWGLDGLCARLAFLKHHPRLRLLVA